MKKGEFKYSILSAHDREKLTCEISFNNEIIAEISQEEGELLLEIFPPQFEKWWEVSLEDFQKVLEEGKRYLKSGLK